MILFRVVLSRRVRESQVGTPSISSYTFIHVYGYVYKHTHTQTYTKTHTHTHTQAWADIIALSLEAPEDEEGTLATKNLIHSLIADEVKAGVPANRIVIGGFSQGAGWVLNTR
jgi:predicted esterase